MTSVTPAQAAAAFGLTGDLDGPAYPGLAALVRQAVARWGLCTHSQLRALLDGVAEATGFQRSVSRERLKEVLERLQSIGDIVSVQVDTADFVHEPEADQESGVTPSIPDGNYFVPGALRLVRFGERVLVCGSRMADPQCYDPVCPPNEPASCVRWLSFSDEPQLNAIEGEEDVWAEPQEWLGPPEYLEVLQRMRSAAEPPADSVGRTAQAEDGLAELWHLFAQNLRSCRIDDPKHYRILTGSSGDFFGHYKEMTGRWRWLDASPDGVRLAVRQAVGENHFKPVVVDIQGHTIVRQLDLFSWDEFRWVVLARGCALREPEIFRVHGTEVVATTWLPLQLQRFLSLGRRDGNSWKWRLPDGSVSTVVELLRTYGGFGVT